MNPQSDEGIYWEGLFLSMAIVGGFMALVFGIVVVFG